MIANISVIIPVYNGGEAFSSCLASLLAASLPPLEIIVVDDHSEDDSALIAQKFGTTLIRLDQQYGPAYARNRGAEIAQGEILFFIDADIVVPPYVIDKVATVFQAEPALSAIFGSYDDAPVANNFLSQYKNLFHHYVHQTSQIEASTFWSGCGAIRREAFLSVGGFNEERFYQPAIEDIELGYRLKRLGHRIRLEKSLQVKHLKRWRILPLLKTDFFYRALPWTELILTEGGLINDLNINRSTRISIMLTYLLLFALSVSVWQLPLAIMISSSSMLLLLFLNWQLYFFFLRKRGILFSFTVLPWHWLYFLYCGLAFIIGIVRCYPSLQISLSQTERRR
ncbi:MAG: glycosyltransferase family A protein, partial [Acidobacteriota bacterium]